MVFFSRLLGYHNIVVNLWPRFMTIVTATIEIIARFLCLHLTARGLCSTLFYILLFLLSAVKSYTIF